MKNWNAGFWVFLLALCSAGLIWRTWQYLDIGLSRPVALGVKPAAETLVLELDPVRYYTVVLENPDREDPSALGKKLAADGFYVISEGAPSAQVLTGLVKEAVHLTALHESLLSAGWQSRVEGRQFPETSLVYAADDVFFSEAMKPCLIRTCRWVGRLVDFLDDPWEKVRSAQEARTRLSILSEELAVCGEAARQARETAPEREGMILDALLVCMDQLEEGLAALEREGDQKRHDLLVQRSLAFLCLWKDLIGTYRQGVDKNYW